MQHNTLERTWLVCMPEDGAIVYNMRGCVSMRFTPMRNNSVDLSHVKRSHSQSLPLDQAKLTKGRGADGTTYSSQEKSTNGSESKDIFRSNIHKNLQANILATIDIFCAKTSSFTVVI